MWHGCWGQTGCSEYFRKWYGFPIRVWREWSKINTNIYATYKYITLFYFKCFLSNIHTPTDASESNLVLVSCLGIFGMQTEAAKDQTTNLPVCRWHALLPERKLTMSIHLWITTVCPSSDDCFQHSPCHKAQTFSNWFVEGKRGTDPLWARCP